MPHELRRLANRALKRVSRRLPESVDARPGLALLDLDDVLALPRGEFEAACRRLTAALPVSENVALCRILGRYKAYVDPRDASLAAHLLLDGFWEYWLTRFIAGFVRPGWTVADLGANYGYFTLMLAELVGPDGRVVAVEPNRDAARLLRRSLAVNGFEQRVSLHELAAGSTDGGTATLVVTPTMSGGAAITDGVARGSLGDEASEVPVARLDTLLAAEQRIDFMKIDVEGSEERVIAGMEGIFARGRPHLVLEFNPVRYRDPGAFLMHLLAFYPSLREIDFAGNAVSVHVAQVLAEPTERLLFLSAS